MHQHSAASLSTLPQNPAPASSDMPTVNPAAVIADAFSNNSLRFIRNPYSSSVMMSLTSFLDCVGVILGKP